MTATTLSKTKADDLKAKFLDETNAAKQYAELLQPYRSDLADAKAALDKAFAEKHAEVLKGEADSQSLADAYEADLRELAVEHFNETGEKTLDENLGVRVNTKLTYETGKAVAWAETNAPVMIVKTVDKNAFESLPTVSGLDFVTVDTSVSAVIKGLK